ncbi:hypothetical protein [Lactobacillus amylovorus]|uniref:hypothetical protein n=1 Tax=Lactobacillus amylovorus TaxID=1604 RepID=UPI000E54A321|nr:hypothetical protein [Lactobacillus amylovorus]RGW85204.1 hypothetical protein DWV49_04710 [Lactobacillus amylovorus]
MNNDETNIDLDLTNVHDGQYLTVDDNDGTVQIAQVQESSVDNSYNLNPVDIANITLDLSNDYDLLKTLVEEATKEKLDLSGLIMAWLKQYPDLSAALLKTKTDLDDANKLVATYKSQVDELTDQNKELEKEINDLQAEKEKNQQNTPSTGGTTSNADQNAKAQTSDQETNELKSNQN